MPELSASAIISLAACHVCCAMINEPCSFNRTEDPDGRRRSARASHVDRIKRAAKRMQENFASAKEFHELPLDKAAVIRHGQLTQNAD